MVSWFASWPANLIWKVDTKIKNLNRQGRSQKVQKHAVKGSITVPGRKLDDFNCGRSCPTERKPKMNLSQRPVRFEYGVPKVSQQIAEFMASIKAKIATRYALNYVGITNSQMAVIDSRRLRLLVVSPTDTFDPPIADGLYHLTGEGFLLKTEEEGKFPKWQDIIPTAANTLGDFVINDDIGHGVAKAVRTISKTDILLNVKWLLATFAGLKSCGCSVVTVKKEEGNNPIQVTAEAVGVNFQYVQMPLSE